MHRILICGDRLWTNGQLILHILTTIGVKNIEVVIEGACRGADRLGGAASRQLGIPVLEFPANWTKFGKSAGPIRNRQMLTEGKPNLVLAFHNNIKNSKGTKDMVNVMRAGGVPVRIITQRESK